MKNKPYLPFARSWRVALPALCVLVLAACVPVVTPSSTHESLVTATETPMLITPTATIPTVELIQIDSLVPGEYMVYLDNPASSSPDDIFLSLAQPDGEYVGVLSKVRTTIVSISPNLKLIAELPDILDLSAGTTTTYEELRDCWDPSSWAPNNQGFVVSCTRNDGVNLFVFWLENRLKLQITDFGEEFSGRMPSWSPDGKWIAFYKSHNMSGSSEQTGLHLINVDCFSSPTSCACDEPGIGVGYPYTWSPDSQYVAGRGTDPLTGNNSIDIFSITNGILSLHRKYSIDTAFDWISWAPSSDVIVLATRENTLLLFVETGEVQKIRPLPFLFWISVP